MIDLATLSDALGRRDDGVWVPKSGAKREVSFPEGGHAECYRLEDESFWFRHRSACILKALAPYALHGPFLDVGGGNGAVSAALERAGVPSIMLEPGEEGAANARRRGLPNVVCATLEDASFAPRAFEAAGAFDVIEHVDDAVSLLASIRRVLRPGGVLCVTVPAFSWLWSVEDEVAGHYRRYTLRTLSDALVAARFDVRYATYFFSLLTGPLFLGRTLRSRLGRRAASDVETTAAREHVPSPAVRKVAEAALAPEIDRIAKRRVIPVGTSCLAVATVA